MLRSRAVWALLFTTVVAAAMIVLREGSRETSVPSRPSISSGSPAPSPGSRVDTSSGGPSVSHPSRLTISHGPLELRIDRTRRVADGVYLHEVIQPAGPNQLRVLEVDPSTPATLELVGAGRSYPHLAPTSRIAEHGDALAGVNGEFFTVPGRPEFLFQSDGTLWQTALHDSNMFAISEDERRIYVRRIRPSISASGDGSTLRVSNWNTVDPSSGGEVSGYTPIGGSVAVPPSRACYLELGHESGPSWSAGRTATTRSYLVSRSGCGARAPSLHGGIDLVLAANALSSGARDLARFRSGDRVRMEWSVGLPNVLDIAGGQPVLVKDGHGVVPRRCDSSFCAPQPRTAVGYTSDGRVLIATVDGRQAGWSVGMSLREWAQAFVQMGAEGVLNLDGGGSTTMWVRGEGVVNRPSNAGHRQRRVGTALLVLPGEDTDVPTSLQ